MLYPTIIRIPCPFYQKLRDAGVIRERRDKTGAVIAPLVDHLPGWFHCYAEFKDPNNKLQPTTYEWAYTEVRNKETVLVVTSAGWKEWMFNFNPSVSDCVAYHVRLIIDRCNQLQAQRLEQAIANRAAAA